MDKINRIVNLVGNMGWRYVAFRVKHELLRRSGLMKKRFPANPPFKQYLTLADWKKQTHHFFFQNKADIAVDKRATPELKERFDQIKSGKLLLFNSILTDLGKNYDWVTNPDSGFRYDAKKHWTEIPDLSKEAGDIKFVWEKSRFSYLYDIIRYDYHFNEDCAEQVFHDIISWIDNNPVNCGPNYRCSQEMSLRVLNWTFALHYYHESADLTDEVFNKIQYAIYWHMDHVYNNIDFSRIAVRNNHAITETLTLFLAGLFYPTLPGAAMWKKKGKAWFEQEVAYQVYDDGTFLQFSMNYHRIVVQLLTWGIALSEKNGERFADVVYDRARKSLKFLRTCIVEENGWLPNYGANDGALFFKLSDSHYRDYRPQLQGLASVLGMNAGIEAHEDAEWYGTAHKTIKETWQPQMGTHEFPKGGYYIVREPQTLTFIKCGGYKDRPSQADNLHIDIWYKGENMLVDAGSYKYNTDDETMRYFNGTRSHNTVMVNDKDQMLKGGRFIWYYWSQCRSIEFEENDQQYIFSGSLSAFKHINDGIVHKRTVVKKKGAPEWRILDEISGMNGDLEIKQLWHIPLSLHNKISLKATEAKGTEIQPLSRDGWYSSLYGQKEKTREFYFSTENAIIDTTIKIAD
jgi:hypothetical protein